MQDFDYIIPTKVLFGRNKIEHIGKEIKPYARRILLVYGQGSIKRIGVYDEIVKILNKENIIYEELTGVLPNPRIESVRRGIELCRKNSLEFILAAGGGSVIDCAKAIACGFYYDGDPWDFFLQRAQVKKALPLGTVLTLSATGSEMNGYSVISNEEREEKLAVGSDVLRPVFSILDPAYTFTVPQKHTAAGVVDIFSHILEQYFCMVKDAFVQDRLAEGILKTCIEYGPIAINKPRHYQARANLMWASSLALNGILRYGKVGDWATHAIEHVVSAVYDITHGVGLAIIIPHWMEYVLDEKTVYKFVEYAQNVWGISGGDDFTIAGQGIKRTKEFFRNLGMPVSLSEVGIDGKRLEDMAQKTVMFGKIGEFRKLNRDDVLKILKASL